jgi:hypothetical protein
VVFSETEVCEMKKEVRKLTLSRETLRLLNGQALGKVRGGYMVDTASGCCGDTVTCTNCCEAGSETLLTQ